MSVAEFAMALAALFGKRKTPEEMLRQNQRALNKVNVAIKRENASPVFILLVRYGFW